jgi:hypothetical protein
MQRTFAVMILVRTIAACLLLVALACGSGGRENPAAPSQPAGQTVAALVINGVDAVLTGSVTSYAVTATMSDGTTRTVTPAWVSSDPGVGTVDSTGRLDGRAHGSTNLTASYLGRDVSKIVYVVNNYGGTWNGQYVIRACNDSGDLHYRDGGWCQRRVRVGTIWPIRLVLSQSGSNLSEIGGTLGLTEVGVVDKITGVVTADGRLSLTGSLNVLDYYGEVLLGTVQIQTWDTNLGGHGVMTGRWSQNFSSIFNPVGNAFTENELVTMTQTSNSATSVARRP